MLTIKLKNFIIWLIVFATAQIVIAGVQSWKMFPPERRVQVVIQPAQSTGQQPQPVPAH